MVWLAQGWGDLSFEEYYKTERVTRLFDALFLSNRSVRGTDVMVVFPEAHIYYKRETVSLIVICLLKCIVGIC